MTSCCVIPTYRAAQSICSVVRAVLEVVDFVIVVDDNCPEHSADQVEAAFAEHSGVVLHRRTTNGGVGAAVKTGLEIALKLNADIIIKIDSDGQMDPAYVPYIIDVLASDPTIMFVKGNRFVNAAVLHLMPRVRLLGNSLLSIFSKFSTGYWNLLDPTNGYIAFRAPILSYLDFRALDDGYFFEISVLCELGLYQAHIAEIEMPPRYAGEQSSLSISRVVRQFPPRLLRRFWRRLLFQYAFLDVNLGTLFLIGGLVLTLGSSLFLGGEWLESIRTDTPRTVGTVMLGVLPLLAGIQLLFNTLVYDVLFAPPITREFRFGAKGRKASLATSEGAKPPQA